MTDTFGASIPRLSGRETRGIIEPTVAHCNFEKVTLLRESLTGAGFQNGAQDYYP